MGASGTMPRLRLGVGVAAALLLGLALLRLAGQTDGLAVAEVRIGATPATVFTRAGADAPAPAVVIAHGFSGSRQLMAPFATTLARTGYVAVAYDALGHGRNPAPLTGDVTREDGATAALLDEMAEVAAFARAHAASDGRLAVLGHSMASDIVVRHAIADPATEAVVAVSLFSPAATAEAPQNLLVITGALEAGLTDEALRVAGLPLGIVAEPFTTYGAPGDGPARRAVLSPSVEHIGVLYSPTSLREARDWLDASFGRAPAGTEIDARGPWILALFAAFVALAWAAAPLLPQVAAPETLTRPAAGIAVAGPAAPAAPADPVPAAPPARPPAPRRRRFALAILGPALAAPLAAWALPAGIVPVAVPVADYLALHFLLYGLLTGLALWWLGLLPRRPAPGPLAAATGALAAFGILSLYLPLDAHVAAFLPTPERLPLLGLLVVCLAPYFLADEALTRHPAAPRLAYPLTKLAFLLSLALAIALDLERLFFLVIILPVILLFFVLFGLVSRWSNAATGSGVPAALALSLLFGWAIAVTFPRLG
jgi:dienelactone hydrolase